MKALGTGHSRGVLWKDIEVVRRAGPPELRLTGAALRIFEAMGGRRSLVTITHADTIAMAQVLFLAT
jgi:phosphopantetheinyl transferase (holo-ACP synthase)